MNATTLLRPASPLASILTSRIDNGTYSRLAARCSFRALSSFIKNDARIAMKAKRQ